MKSKFLKVMGIIVFILGIIAACVAVAYFAFNNLLSILGLQLTTAGMVFIVIEAICMVLFGLMGSKWSMRPEKAKLCMIFGVIMVGLVIVSLIITAVDANMLVSTVNDAAQQLGLEATSEVPATMGGNVVLNIIDIAIPALYFLAAFLFRRSALKKAMAAQQAAQNIAK